MTEAVQIVMCGTTDHSWKSMLQHHIDIMDLISDFLPFAANNEDCRRETEKDDGQLTQSFDGYGSGSSQGLDTGAQSGIPQPSDYY